MPALHADFWQVTGDALHYAMETGIGDAGLRRQVMDLYLTFDPFPEVAESLRALKQAGLTTAILSNGEHRSLHIIVAAAISSCCSANIEVYPFDQSGGTRQGRGSW